LGWHTPMAVQYLHTLLASQILLSAVAARHVLKHVMESFWHTPMAEHQRQVDVAMPQMLWGVTRQLAEHVAEAARHTLTALHHLHPSVAGIAWLHSPDVVIRDAV
jgi:hypothetical protein